jgi:NodT family efflux transporter outer membrane factor (OMF) lipoprotein
VAQLHLPVLGLRQVAAVIVAAAALAGCALKPPITPSEVVDQALPATTLVPPSFKAAPADGPVADGWLKSFDDPQLESIVAEAIANNLDLRIAAAKVAIAQQSVIVVGSQMLPHVGAVVGGRTTKDEDRGGTSDSTIAYAGVSWEIDVWGRLRAQRAAAEAGYEATALDYAYARQSLAANTAKVWYLTIETRQLLDLAEQSVTIYDQLLTLVRARRAAGKDSDLDVVDVRAKLETAQSDVERARAQYGEARRGLEVLLGRYPAAEVAVAAKYPPLPAMVGAGIPSALLERRPDIVAAERAVLAAFRNEEAAELALLPEFSFTLVGGRLGDQVLTLLRLNPWLASAGIGVSIPIYEGGALRAKVEIANAQQAQAVARYGLVALRAFREVETSLANEQLYQLQLPLDQKALDDRAEAVRIATIQYKAGRRDLLWVAQLQTVAIAAEADLIKLNSAQRANRVRLHQALGGSFDAAPAASLTAALPTK